MAQDKKHTNLGRGLSALLGEEESVALDPTDGSSLAPSGLQTMPIEFLQPGRYQPRKSMDEDEINELAESIRGQGILQPILVRRLEEGEERYEIIAGERRWRAAQLAQLHEVPIIERQLDDQQALEIAMVENLQRENLSPLDEAEGYRVLMDEFSHTQEGLAESLGKSRSHVANTLRLLNLPDGVKELIYANQLSAGHGRALLGADDPAALAKTVVRRGLNVRQTEKLVKKKQSPAEPSASGDATGGAEKDTDTLALEREMSLVLGLKVEISHGPKGGQLAIHYETLEQLDDVLRRITLGTLDTRDKLEATSAAAQENEENEESKKGEEGSGFDQNFTLSDDELVTMEAQEGSEAPADEMAPEPIPEPIPESIPEPAPDLASEREAGGDDEGEDFEEVFALSDDDLSLLESDEGDGDGDGEEGEESLEELDENFALSDDDLSSLVDATPHEESAGMGDFKLPESDDDEAGET